MKNTIKIFIYVAILFVGCKKPEVEVIPPTLDVVTISEVSTATARLSTNITDSGNQDITDYGFVYSETNISPTFSDTKTSHGAINPATPTPIAFTDVIQNLKPNTTYNVRAYTAISSGPVFSNATTFKTSDIIQPKIRTDAASSIAINSAKLQGTLEAKGTFDIAEYGIVWSSTNANPTTADAKATKTGNITVFPSTFTVDATNLSVNTTFNYRTYVISNGVITYGNTLTFKTLAVTLPSVKTDAVLLVFINSAKLQGIVETKGSYDISEYGICWSSRNSVPTTADSKSSKTNNLTVFPTIFSEDANNLTANTTYYFRAFVVSNGVTTYGSVLTFKTNPVVLPTLSTDGQTLVNDLVRNLNGTLLTKGSYDITEYGMCWSFANLTPTTADSKGSNAENPTSFPARFTIEANGLQGSRTYYYRSYVISNGVTTYGSVLNFNTGKN